MANITEKIRQTTESTARLSPKKCDFLKSWSTSLWSGWLLTQGIQVVYGVQGNPKGTQSQVC